MSLRKLATVAVGGVAAAAAGNALLKRRARDLEPAIPGEQRTLRWRGMDIAYTERGDPDGPTLLLLHGVNAAASANEFGPLVEALAGDYRIVVPDLPGFGRSDRPPIHYDARLYVDFVADFASAVADDPAVVASSLTGTYASLAQRRDAPFSRLVLICPTATTMPTRRPWVESLLRTPVVGTAVFNLITSEASIRYFNRDHGYYDPTRMTDATVEYEWTTAHQPGARFAPAAFVSGMLDPSADLGEVLDGLDVPVTLVWGREADITPLSYGRDLAEAADARLVVFDRTRLLPHVEYADDFASTLVEELSSAEH